MPATSRCATVLQWLDAQFVPGRGSRGLTMTQADVTVAVFWLFGRAKRPRFFAGSAAEARGLAERLQARRRSRHAAERRRWQRSDDVRSTASISPSATLLRQHLRRRRSRARSQRILRAQAMFQHQPRKQRAARIGAGPGGLRGHQHGAGDVIERARRLPRVLFQRGSAATRSAKASARSSVCRRRSRKAAGIAAASSSNFVSAAAMACARGSCRRRADDVERVDVAGAFPEHADLGVAHQPRAAPIPRCSRCRRAPPCAWSPPECCRGRRGTCSSGVRMRSSSRRPCRAGIGAAHRVGGEQEHRQRLLGRQR